MSFFTSSAGLNVHGQSVLANVSVAKTSYIQIVRAVKNP